MKKQKFLALALAFLTGFAFAQSQKPAMMPLNLTAADGTIVTIHVPADVLQIAAPHMTEINNALAAHGVTSDQIKSVEKDIKSAYENIRNYISTDSPYTTVVN